MTDTKRCCGPNGCGKVRDTGAGSPANQERYCIGADCMAWRWLQASAFVRWEGSSMVMQDPPPPPTEGYCGLVGAP